MSYNKTTKKKVHCNTTNTTTPAASTTSAKQSNPSENTSRAKFSKRKKVGGANCDKKKRAKITSNRPKKNEKCVHLTAKRSNRAVTARTRAQCFDAAAGPARHAVVDQNSAYRDVDAKCRRLLFGITCVVASVCMRMRACVNSCSSSTLPCSHLTTTGKNNNNNNS